ncbi:hypothetical protein RKD39_002420 [Streptomyces albogriseolus]
MNMVCFCSAVRWQAAARPSPSAGRSVLQRLPDTLSVKAQRGWKGQPEGGFSRLGGDPGIGVERLRGVAAEARHRAEQAPGVGVLGLAQHFADAAALHGPARVHHQQVVGHVGDDAEVVGDEDDRGPELLLEVLEQVEDLRLDRHVQGRGRLVGDQQVGVADQRHGDHGALAHTAGELVRVVVHTGPGLRDADLGQHLDRPLPGLPLGGAGVLHERLGDLPAHRVVRRERRQRVLEDHRDLVAAELLHLLLGGGDQVAPLEDDLALDGGALGVVQTEDGQVGHGLAGARFAHDAEGLAALDVEGQSVDRLDDAVLGGEPHPQVADREEGARPGRGLVAFGLGQCGHGVSPS